MTLALIAVTQSQIAAFRTYRRARVVATDGSVRGISMGLPPVTLHDIVIHMPNPSETATSVLSVRVNADERATLEAASEQARMSLSDFVRRKALEAAEIDVTERRIVTIPAKDWDAFEAWVNEPARSIRAVKKLAKKKSKSQR